MPYVLTYINLHSLTPLLCQDLIWEMGTDTAQSAVPPCPCADLPIYGGGGMFVEPLGGVT